MNTQILYIDPMTPLYDQSITKFTDYITEYRIKPKFDIDSINIINNNSKPLRDENHQLKELIDKYFTYDVNVLGTKQNMVTEEVEVQQQVEQQALVVNQIISIPYDSTKVLGRGIIYYDFKYRTIEVNQLLVITEFGKLDNIREIGKHILILIYDNTNNNLILIDIDGLTRFLMYNDNIIDRYTIISLYNRLCYGKLIDIKLLNHLLRVTLGILTTIRDQRLEKLETDIISSLIQSLMLIKYDDTYVFPNPPLVLNFLRIQPSYRYASHEDYSFSMSRYEGESVYMPKPLRSSFRPDGKISNLSVELLVPINVKPIEIMPNHRMPKKKDLLDIFEEFNYKWNNKKEKKERRVREKELREQKMKHQKFQKHSEKQQKNPRGGNINDVDMDSFYYEKYMKYKIKYLALKKQESLF